VSEHTAWLLLGSNIRPAENLRRAVQLIGERAALLQTSSVWESPPAERSDQPHYLNAAVLLRTDLAPEELLERLIVPIERALGRKRSADRFAARPIDIDLALYDDRTAGYLGRQLPHPDILTRAHFAVPLAEISPEKIHPATGEPLQAIAGRLRTADIRRREDLSLSAEKDPPPTGGPKETPMPTFDTHPADFDVFRDDLTDRASQGCEGDIGGAVRTILQGIGEDPQREGLVRTPLRVTRMLEEMTIGYHVDPQKLVNEAIFTVKYDQMVVVRDIDLASLCEHHLLPFVGKAHVAYIPDGKVIGLSKIPRVVEMFARRLQLQERMTEQIADFLEDVLKPCGVAVVADCAHMCMAIRGVKKANARMVTCAVRGSFKENLNTRNEFFAHIDRGRME
jgi:GTP cyclohydrolase I